jgi:hypothetical protein
MRRQPIVANAGPQQRAGGADARFASETRRQPVLTGTTTVFWRVITGDP